jgi:hypothetical protein
MRPTGNIWGCGTNSQAKQSKSFTDGEFRGAKPI